jgi:hypothetical protein
MLILTLQIIAWTAVMAVVLLWPAGTLAYPGGWNFLVLFAAAGSAISFLNGVFHEFAKPLGEAEEAVDDHLCRLALAWPSSWPCAADPAQASDGRWHQGLTIAKMAEWQWLKPALVGHFEFLEWTADNHLRHSKFVASVRTKRQRMSSANERFQAIWSCPVCQRSPISAGGGSHVTFRSPIPSHRRRQEERDVQMGTAEGERKIRAGPDLRR